MSTTLLCCLYLATTAIAAPIPKGIKKTQDDAALLQGRWVNVSVDLGTGAVADTGWWMEFKDGKLSSGRDTSPGYVGRAFKLDQAAGPKHLDVDDLWGRYKLGIYELDGDTLTWCESPSRVRRPTEFKAAKGDSVFVLKRVEKKDK